MLAHYLLGARQMARSVRCLYSRAFAAREAAIKNALCKHCRSRGKTDSNDVLGTISRTGMSGIDDVSMSDGEAATSSPLMRMLTVYSSLVSWRTGMIRHAQNRVAKREQYRWLVELRCRRIHDNDMQARPWLRSSRSKQNASIRSSTAEYQVPGNGR